MSEQISVLVVDDEPVIRAGLSAILDSQSDITVAGTADDGEEAVEACARLRPDVLLMDIRMPRRDGPWAPAELGRRRPLGPGRSRVPMLTTFDLDEYVDDALAAGASGFLLKNGRLRGRGTGRWRAAVVGPDVDSHPFRDRPALLSPPEAVRGAVAVGPRRRAARAEAAAGQAGGQLRSAMSATCRRSSRVAPLAAWTAMPFATVMR
ncbi:response regulator transcription factor [Streptomyces sp. NPDC015220]|uniref:response regulator n=1 Tax=Streptomyces sp. NPDC015220 TaxID=3364947 RepID=UPI0036FD7FB0